MNEYSLKIVLDRTEIENNVFSCKATFLQLMQNPLEYKDNVEVFVSGYEGDERELFEIPEVKAYIREIDEFFPFWTFFINKNTLCLRWISYCLMDNCIFDRVNRVVKVDNNELGNLLIKFFNAQNYIFDTFKFDEQENERLSDVVIQYFQLG